MVLSVASTCDAMETMPEAVIDSENSIEKGGAENAYTAV
jgi:hypothetical protein